MRPDFLGVRLTSDERALLHQLARREEATLSDVVRQLIRKAAQTDERPAKSAEALLTRP
jgi:hypothetical protein